MRQEELDTITNKVVNIGIATLIASYYNLNQEDLSNWSQKHNVFTDELPAKVNFNKHTVEPEYKHTVDALIASAQEDSSYVHVL